MSLSRLRTRLGGSLLTLLDYVLVALIAWGALNGLRRGLLSIVVGLAGTLLAWYLAARYAPSLARWLNSTQGWVSSTAHYLAGRIPLPAGVAGLPLSTIKPDALPVVMGQLPLPAALQKATAEAAASAMANAATLHLFTLGDLVYYSLASLVWTGITFFVIMAVATGLANAVARQMTRALEGTPLSLANQLAGAALGAAETLVVLVVAAGLLVPLLHLLRWPALQKVLSGSQLLPYFAAWFHRWSPWKVL